MFFLFFHESFRNIDQQKKKKFKPKKSLKPASIDTNARCPWGIFVCLFQLLQLGFYSRKYYRAHFF